MWKSVHYEPWEGFNYAKGYQENVRLLLLGDSHYGDDRRTATAYWLGRHIQGGEFQFWSALEQMVHDTQLDTTKDRERFWNAVAFANVFQSSMEQPGDQPTVEQKKIANPAFIEMLAALQPDLVLVFSKRAWECLPGEQEYPGSHNLDGLYAPAPLNSPPFLFCTPQHKIVGAALNHPRNPGAAFKAWHDWVELLIVATRRFQTIDGSRSARTNPRPDS
jgi:hypothetical protein